MAAPIILNPFATSGDVSVLPDTDPSGFVNYATGYTPDYEINLSAGDPQAKAVERGVQNYLFNILTANVQEYQQYARPLWYNNMPGGYAQWAEVMYPSGPGGTMQPYRSLAPGNVSTPGSSTSWEYVQGSGEMLSNVPMPSGGSTGPNAQLVVAPRDFNLFNSKGTWQFATDATVTGSPNYPTNGGTNAQAGFLEVMAWTASSNNYVSQFFRDRAGMAFVRGSTNNSWTTWKLWAQSFQYVVGEMRMWYGTTTQAAVAAAFGPGWYLCDGTNGTPNMQGKIGLGANATYPNGTSGGAASFLLQTSQLPAHNHVINIGDPGHVDGVTDNGHVHGLSDPGHNHYINDPGHNHGVNDPQHTHGIYDPGHAHGVGDPGHSHSIPNLGSVQAGADNGGAQCPVNTGYSSGRGQNNVNGSGTGIWIGGSATSIGINPNYTGIYLSAAATGIWNSAAATGLAMGNARANVGINTGYTGIYANSNSTGGGQAIPILPPYLAVNYVMFTGK